MRWRGSGRGEFPALARAAGGHCSAVPGSAFAGGPEGHQKPPWQPLTAESIRQASGNPKQVFWRLARRVTLWALIAFLLAAFGAHRVNGPNFNTTFITVPRYPAIYPIAHRATVVLLVVVAVVAALWWLVGLGWYLRLVWQTTGEAMKPIPSLAEIDQRLRDEGYNPTIANVVAMHQHLTSQRNEAAFFAGALVVGPQLLARQAHGEPLL